MVVRLVEETARHGPGDEGIATAVGFDDGLWMFAVNGVDPILVEHHHHGKGDASGKMSKGTCADMWTYAMMGNPQLL